MKRLFKENYTEENLIGRKITTAYGADRDPHNAKPATIVDAHRRRTSTGMVFDLTIELDNTGETIEQTFNPLSVGDKYTWGPWFRDGEERQYNPYEREYSESRKLVKEYDDGPDVDVYIHRKDYYDTEFEEGDKVILTQQFYDHMDVSPREMPSDGWVITDIRKSGERNSYEIECRVKGKGTYSYWVYDEEIKKAKKRKMRESRKIVKEYEDGTEGLGDTYPSHRINSKEKYELYCDMCRRYGEKPMSWSKWKREQEEDNGGLQGMEESKLVKEGAGAGYDVGISELEIGEVTDIQKDGEYGYTFTAKIVPGTYEISAEDYYNDFFWEEHGFGITPKAKIDGGEIHGTICPWEDTDDPEFWIQRQVEGSTFNLSFMYGGGWVHVDLPEDGQIYVDEHLDITPELYFSIDDIHLDAIDLVQAVNSGHASIFDRDEEDEEPVDESDYAPLGRGKPKKSKDVIVKVDVEWAGMDSEDDDEQYLDDVGLPGSVYIKIPFESYADEELNYDLRTKLGKTFDGYVEDYTYHRVEPRAVPKGVPIYIWRPETDIMEEF